MSEFRSRSTTFLFVAQICGALLGLSLASAPAAQAQESLTPGSFRAYAAEGVEPRMSDFSGLPVPRYASLKYDKVNGRSGPSPDYPIRWTYERAGLPVVVIRETNDWRKVRDPMGDEVWVSKSQLSEQRHAVTTHAGLMRRDPAAEAPAEARFNPGTVVSLGECGTVWCPVKVQGQKGWILREHLWGTDALPPAPATTPGNR